MSKVNGTWVLFEKSLRDFKCQLLSLSGSFFKKCSSKFLNLLFWNAWEFPVQSEFIIKKSFVLRSHLLKAPKDF